VGHKKQMLGVFRRTIKGEQRGVSYLEVMMEFAATGADVTVVAQKANGPY
jgi:hypothetical protein